MAFFFNAHRRQSLRAAAALLACLATGGAMAHTAAVKVLVGFPPGGGTDAIARILADKLKDQLGVPVSIMSGPTAPSLDMVNPSAVGHVAKAFPKVEFYHATGFKSAPNVTIYNSRMYEPAFLAGMIAGHVSKKGVLGFVASFPIPEVVRNINAYTMGARSVNPKITTKVVWVNTWFDPSKERQAAEALIGQGADVLLQNTDSSAVLQTAQDKGVFAFGWDSDMTAYGPKAHLASAIEIWGGYYGKVAEAAIAGKPLKTTIWGGIKEGMNDLVSLSANVPAAAKKMVEEKKALIKDGKLAVFTGPIKGSDGSIKVAAGKTLTDKEIDSINWYVEGVEGQLPGK